MDGPQQELLGRKEAYAALLSTTALHCIQVWAGEESLFFLPPPSRREFAAAMCAAPPQASSTTKLESLLNCLLKTRHFVKTKLYNTSIPSLEDECLLIMSVI